MNSSEVRLLVEAVLVTTALIFGGGVSLWGFVQMRRRTPDAIAELNASNDEMARRLRLLENRQERYHLAQLQMQSRLEMQSEYSRRLADYAKMLADRLRGLGETDIPPAPAAPPGMDAPLFPTPTASDSRKLEQRIAQQFSLAEIDDLAFQLGIDREEIGGETRGARALALVDYAGRHGLSDELTALARQLRPEGDF